jgi:hypothetical protein
LAINSRLNSETFFSDLKTPSTEAELNNPWGSFQETHAWRSQASTARNNGGRMFSKAPDVLESAGCSRKQRARCGCQLAAGPQIGRAKPTRRKPAKKKEGEKKNSRPLVA